MNDKTLKEYLTREADKRSDLTGKRYIICYYVGEERRIINIVKGLAEAKLAALEVKAEGKEGVKIEPFD